MDRYVWHTPSFGIFSLCCMSTASQSESSPTTTCLATVTTVRCTLRIVVQVPLVGTAPSAPAAAVNPREKEMKRGDPLHGRLVPSVGGSTLHHVFNFAPFVSVSLLASLVPLAFSAPSVSLASFATYVSPAFDNGLRALGFSLAPPSSFYSLGVLGFTCILDALNFTCILRYLRLTCFGIWPSRCWFHLCADRFTCSRGVLNFTLILHSIPFSSSPFMSLCVKVP